MRCMLNGQDHITTVEKKGLRKGVSNSNLVPCLLEDKQSQDVNNLM